jgi:V/A-type H+-transporting ATPase subunit I
MAIVKMKRLRLLALAADRDELLQRLLRAGCVEITEPDVELSDPEWAALVGRDRAMVGSAKSKVTSVNSALEVLKKYAPAKSGLFIKRKNIEESKFCNPEQRASALEKAAEINEYNRQIGQINSLQNRLASNRLGLLPWSTLDVDLSLRQTAAAGSFWCLPRSDVVERTSEQTFRKRPSAEFFHASSDREQHYMLVVCHKDDEERVMDVLRPFAFNPAPLKDVKGSAAENIAEWTDRLRTD